MPTFDKMALGKKAREYGFVRDAFEKMSRLTDILQFINSDRELNPFLALKGGTAINLTIFNLPRLSVDIDLDFTKNMPREETAVKRGRINEVLGQFMANEGYKLKDKSKHTHVLDSYVYSYANAVGNSDNIKIELNYILRCHVLPANEVITRTGGAFPDFTVRTLAPVEIFASKIGALINRGAARDLYDLNNMVCFDLFDKPDLPLLRKCAVFYLAIAGDVAQGFDLSKLNAISTRDIKTSLHPMIRNQERFDLQAARDRVAAFLNEWMALTEKEADFLKHFTAGRYEPQLLFDDSEIINRVENHPMALWRLQHIRKERGGSG